MAAIQGDAALRQALGGDGWLCPIFENACGVRAFAPIVEDVKLDGDALLDALIAETCLIFAQRVRADILNCEGYPISLRLQKLERKAGGEGFDTDWLTPKGAPCLILPAIRQLKFAAADG